MSMGGDSSKDTIIQYEKRATQLVKRRFGKTILSAETPVALVPFLIDLKPKIRPSSWRHYKASLMWLFEFWMERNDSDQSYVPVAFARLAAETQTGSMKRSECTGRTSAAKKKSFPLVDRDRSEEHTSELQSRENLVCRLLLEK